jgi:hypothetical protein
LGIPQTTEKSIRLFSDGRLVLGTPKRASA